MTCRGVALVDVEPGATYLLSALIKTRGVQAGTGRGVLMQRA